MNQEWPTQRFGNICAFVRGPFGGSLKKSIFVDEGFAVYEQQHAIYNQFEEIRYFIPETKFYEMRRFELRPNDLIMSCSGTMGKVAIVPDNIRRGIINQALLKLTPSKSVLPVFLKYWMSSSDFQESLKEQSGGAAIQNVASVGLLKEILTPVPPLAEQQRIVGILDEAFEAIATAKANAKRNLQNAHTLFRSTLNFELSNRSGWTRTTVGDQVTLQRGFDITKDQQKPGIVPVVSSGGVKSFHDTAMVSAPGVVIGRKGTLGKVFYMDDDYWPHDTTLWIKHFNGNHARFVYYFFTNLEVVHLDSGTANPALNRNQIHPITVDWPPLPEQKAISEKLDLIATKCGVLESIYQQKLTVLEALKKSLLHQAFSGVL